MSILTLAPINRDGKVFQVADAGSEPGSIPERAGAWGLYSFRKAALPAPEGVLVYCNPLRPGC